MASPSLNSLPWEVETGVQLLARLGATRKVLNVEPKLFPLGLRPGSIMEVHGGEGSGKTEFLLTIISHCIMPTHWKSIPTNGLGISIIYVDTDQHFNILRLVSIIEKRLRRALVAGNVTSVKGKEVQDEVKNILNNFSYASCFSSSQLIITLHAVREKIVNDCALSLIIVDSLSAFYWEDRMMRESGSSLEVYYSYVADIIGRIARVHRVNVIFTTQLLMRSRDFYFMGQDIKRLLDFRLKFDKSEDGSRRTATLENVGETTIKTMGFAVTDVGIVFN